MKRTGALILALALCIPLAMAACGGGGGGGGGSTNSEYNSTDTPISIPDNDLLGISSDINVAGFAGTISKVTVDVYITHTYDSDLIIDIQSPDGTIINLAYWDGDDGEDFRNTTFDDDAIVDIWNGTAPFSGSYRPWESLSDMNGEDPNGTWTLYVVDDTEEDTGQLRSWGLNID